MATRQNDDPRFVRTRVLLRDALLELSRDDPQTITISQLCQVTGVERATFYRHFSNVDGLISDTLAALADARLAEWEQVEADAIDRRDVAREIFVAYLRHITEYWGLYRWALWQQQSGATLLALHDRLRSGSAIELQLLAGSSASPEEDAYLPGFLAGGLVGALLEWLRDDEPRRSPEQLASWLMNPGGR
jgi:AcrR family transcriptional regulator